MKKILSTLVMAVCLFYVSRAQDSLRNHWKSLNLTEDQQNKIAALQKEQHTKMLAILTPEQRKQFEQQKLDMKQRKIKKSDARMKKLKSELKLSPEQSVKMDRLNQDYRQDAELVRANQTLAAAEQRKQLKSLAEAHQADMKAILDPDQQSILEEMKARRNKPSSR